MASVILALLMMIVTPLLTVVLVRGARVYRAPCAAVGLMLAVLICVPAAVMVAVVNAVIDRHIGQSAPLLTDVVSIVLVLVCAVVLTPVLWRLGHVNARVRRWRERHHALLDLFAVGRPDLGPVDVLPDQRPFAYAVPRRMSGRIVLSAGLLGRVGDAALRAILAHERAHLLARHHLMVQLGAALADAFPGVPLMTAFPRRLGELIEMSADCYARRSVGQSPAIAALAACTGHAAATSTATMARMAHLRARRHRCEPSSALMAYAISAAILVVPVAVFSVNRMVDICAWTTI